MVDDVGNQTHLRETVKYFIESQGVVFDYISCPVVSSTVSKWLKIFADSKSEAIFKAIYLLQLYFKRELEYYGTVFWLCFTFAEPEPSNL